MRKKSLSILALVIAGLVTGYFFLLLHPIEVSGNIYSTSSSTSIGYVVDDTAFGGLFARPHPDQSLPHYIYQRQADSVQNIINEIQLENKGIAVSGISMGPVGLFYASKLNDKGWQLELLDEYSVWVKKAQSDFEKKRAATTNKDSLRLIKKQFDDSMTLYSERHNNLLAERENKRSKLYYLALAEYMLKDKDTRFFVQNGTYNLAYVKWDSTNYEGTNTFGHYERKQIPVRYAAEKNLLYIPVSKGQYKVLNVVFQVIIYGIMFLTMYVFIGFPIHILINISKGKPFDDKNIRRLDIMAKLMLAAALLSLLMPYILRFFFRNSIPDDFIMTSFWKSLWNNSRLFIIALVIFITGKAFRKGNKLQKEQDLTI